MTWIHHAKNFGRIGLLALITLIFAALFFFFPRHTIAPKNDTVTPTNEPSPTLEESSAFSLTTLVDNNHVTPGQIITGKAPGYWFFEGSFPVTLQDINGTTFATVIAKTDQDWMVTKNVDFTITLPESFKYSGVGSILFKKDDPSGGEAPFNPEMDQKLIPVIFDNE